MHMFNIINDSSHPTWSVAQKDASDQDLATQAIPARRNNSIVRFGLFVTFVDRISLDLSF